MASVLHLFIFPLRENEEFVGYVNVIQERAKRWQSDGTVVKSEVPEYSMENLSIYREALMEAVAETSEEFLDRYFAGETFSENEIRQALRVNVSEGTIVPVMMGSNTMERGMYTLLADIIKYLPSPDQRSATGMNVLTQELFEANYNFAKAKRQPMYLRLSWILLLESIPSLRSCPVLSSQTITYTTKSKDRRSASVSCMS